MAVEAGVGVGVGVGVAVEFLPGGRIMCSPVGASDDPVGASGGVTMAASSLQASSEKVMMSLWSAPGS